MGRPRYLVTGASGFVGGAVANRLHLDGYSVRCQYRTAPPPEHLRRLKAAGAEIVQADFLAADVYARLVDGCDGIVHAVALVKDYGRYAEFYHTNVRITEELLKAAREVGCRRFVYISSTSVHGFGPHRDTSEAGPYYKLISHYQRTKQMAESAVHSAHRHDFICTILRLGLVYGPGDTTTLKPAFDMLVQGKMPSIGNFEVLSCPIYIEDVAAVMSSVLESQFDTCETFNIVNGEKVRYKEAIAYAAELLGVDGPKIYIHPSVARVLAVLVEFASRMTGFRFRPVPTRFLVDELSADYHFSPDKALRVLGFSPRTDWQTGLRHAVRSYLAENPPS